MRKSSSQNQPPKVALYASRVSATVEAPGASEVSFRLDIGNPPQSVAEKSKTQDELLRLTNFHFRIYYVATIAFLLLAFVEHREAIAIPCVPLGLAAFKAAYENWVTRVGSSRFWSFLMAPSEWLPAANLSELAAPNRLRLTYEPASYLPEMTGGNHA